MRGRAGYIHEYAKDLGMNDDEAVYPSFYLRHKHLDSKREIFSDDLKDRLCMSNMMIPALEC